MSLSNIQIAGAIKRTQKGDADSYYGGDDEAWADHAAACAGVPSSIRPGKTVGIFVSGKVVEYWWPDPAHILDGDLIVKETPLPQALGATDSPTFDTVNAGYVIAETSIEGSNITIKHGANYLVQSASAITATRNITWRDLDGSPALLSDIPSPITVDTTPTHSSTNAVQSGGTFDAIAAEASTRASNDAATLASAKGYADGLLVSVYKDCGNWDASGGGFPTGGGTGTSGAIKAGNAFEVSVAGTMGGEPFDIGDIFRALVDTPGQTLTNWARSEHNTQQATEALRGTAKITDQTTIQTETTTNDTDVVTSKKFWFGIARLIAIAQTITGNWNFTGILKQSGNTVETQNNKDTSGGYTGLTLFKINFKNAANTFTSYFTNTNTASRTYTFKDRDGSIADDTDLSTKSDKLVTFNDQTGTAYTLVLTDAGKKIRINNAAANTVTIPLNATVAFAIGTKLSIRNIGAGATTILATSGVTIHGAVDVAQYSEAFLTYESADVWGIAVQLGDVSAFSSAYASLKRDISTSISKWVFNVLEQGGKGNALRFPTGVSCYYTRSDANMPTGNPAAFTVAAWVKNEASSYGFGNLNTILHYGTISGSHDLVVIAATAAIYVGNSGGLTAFGTSVMPLNTPTRVVVTFNGGTVKVYVNAVLISTQTVTLNVTLSGVLSNVGAAGGTSYYSSGWQQQVIASATVWSPTDVTNDYFGGAGVSSPNLTNSLLYLPMQEGSGVPVDYNTSGTTYTVATFNTPVWVGIGNGWAPVSGTSNTPSTGIEVGDGVSSNERGRFKFGDFLSGTWLRGVTLTGTVNNIIAWFTSNNGKTFFSDRATSGTQAVSTVDIDGGVTVGQGYAGVNPAPANGAVYQGTVLIGTATDNLVDPLQVAGNVNLTGKLKISAGTNKSVGSATLVAGTKTVSNTLVTASSKIYISRDTPGGTVGNISAPVASIVPGTSFIINSDNASDTSIINWFFIN